jgi:L-amino acid N-acyltransferase YncA
MEIKIEKAKEKDLKKIKEIFLAGAQDEIKLQYPKKTKEKINEELKGEIKKIFKDYKKELTSSNNYWIVAKVNNEVIAFANAQIKNKDEGWLEFNYVKKEYRRKGIGKKLTKNRVEWLKKKKVKYLCSKAFLKNKPSLNNLKKFGLKPVMIKVQKEMKD